MPDRDHDQDDDALVHVFPAGDGWVVTGGDERHEADDQRGALRVARQVARRFAPSRVVMGPPDGTVRPPAAGDAGPTTGGGAIGPARRRPEEASPGPDRRARRPVAEDGGGDPREERGDHAAHRPEGRHPDGSAGARRSPRTGGGTSGASAGRGAGEGPPGGSDLPAGRAGERPAVAPRPGPPDWGRLAGPDTLGRSVLVGPEQDVPGPWADAPVRELGAAELEDPAVRAELRGVWLDRRRVAWRLPADLGPPPPASFAGPVWAEAVDGDGGAEESWALLVANAVDARPEAGPSFAPATAAVAAGARWAAGDEAGDVVGPDGTAAWCDGGPLRAWTTEEVGGTGVVPMAAIEHGRVQPLRAVPSGAELDPTQQAAVDDPGGRVAVLAPAGSGKTRVLTERTRHLVHGWGLPAAATCLVAFNVRAKEEMRERTADLPGLQVQTLNGMALAIVDGRAPFAPRPQRVRTADERMVRDLVQELVDMPRRANTDPAAAWLEALSAVRLGLRHPREVEAEFGGDVDGLVDVFPRYRRLLADRGLVDFDEQIYRAVEILLEDPEARDQARWATQVLLVDEFQDLAPAHLLLLRLLAGPTGSIFGVGDDDQTIYGYSGASPEWLVRFEHYVPGATRHVLGVNYRCPEPVVAATRSLLSWNALRVAKEIAAGPSAATGDDGLAVRVVADPVATTVERVRELVDAGVPPGEVAVLTRVNALLAPVQVALSAAGVPVAPAVGRSFLERTGVAAALAWLRLASGGGRLRADDIANAARRPARALSPKVVQWMAEQREVTGLDRLARRLKDRDAEKVSGFATDLRSLTATAAGGADTAGLLDEVRSRIGLDGAMGTLDLARRSVDRSSQLDDLRALIALAHLQPDPSKFGRWLRDLLPESLGDRRRPGERPDLVQLSTIHKVKGLEWPHVVVHDVSGGLLPHRLAEDLEEERRIFHVAITRGRQTVTVMADAEAPSGFLPQLDHVRPSADAADLAAAGRTPRARPGAAATPSSSRSRRADPVELDAAGTAALEVLKAWRRDRASKDKVPAYVVASDRTLADVVTRAPRTPAELLEVTGIGPAKLERYGDELLGVLADTLDR